MKKALFILAILVVTGTFLVTGCGGSETAPQTTGPAEENTDDTVNTPVDQAAGTGGGIIDIMCVGELLGNPVRETAVSVQGKVGLLGELLCPCFQLTSCEESIQVWYGLMVENDGTELPEVSVEGIENGDEVVVTGVLKGYGGTHYSEGDFWAESIIKIN
jgi:hypothetical protein